ncbi:hypothetical protein TNCT_488001 [Trichonephila clavata]|uniref:Uncharacterized protein n=1 Tax=Trichonephila clavata TaxID=2740835 RepID=A0A8X6JGJ2_TRICU|nr:hypothetical protein TNCT_488001 [Trichonephila clavata]
MFQVVEAGRALDFRDHLQGVWNVCGNNAIPCLPVLLNESLLTQGCCTILSPRGLHYPDLALCAYFLSPPFPTLLTQYPE